MSDGATPAWVLPANIPFAELKSRDLEECVYWLLDSMGARDLEWRTGGSGGGAPDGGRDLEAVFYTPSPDGEMEAQRWWIECKGRKGTVESTEVKAAVINCASQANLSSVVIASNTTFSNPTRDWVKEWQRSHPQPKIRLWDHEMLERLLSKHPAVVLRLFSDALSPEGLLSATQERFWTKAEYAPVRALESFWAVRNSVKIDASSRFALIANEFSHGSISDRPWGAVAEPEDLLDLCACVFSNLAYLVLKIRKVGVDQEPIRAAIAYVILVSVRSLGAEIVAAAIIQLGITRNGRRFPTDVSEVLLLPILARLQDELGDVCSKDCRRLSGTDRNIFEESGRTVDNYWRAFDPSGRSQDTGDKVFIRLEKLDEECVVGFELNADVTCPLFGKSPDTENVVEFLSIVARVAKVRFLEAKLRYAKEDEQARQWREKRTRSAKLPAP